MEPTEVEVTWLLDACRGTATVTAAAATAAAAAAAPPPAAANLVVGFTIDRASAKCHTPRRNGEVDRLIMHGFGLMQFAAKVTKQVCAAMRARKARSQKQCCACARARVCWRGVPQRVCRGIIRGRPPHGLLSRLHADDDVVFLLFRRYPRSRQCAQAQDTRSGNVCSTASATASRSLRSS